MTLNGVMACILRYFTEFTYDVVKKFTFAISSPGEFLVLYLSVLYLFSVTMWVRVAVTFRYL